MGFEEFCRNHGYLGSLLVHLRVVSMRSRYLVYSVSTMSTAFYSFEILVCSSSSYITLRYHLKASLVTSKQVYIYSVNSSDLQINLMKAGIGQPKYR